jgi:hypothetical protein
MLEYHVLGPITLISHLKYAHYDKSFSKDSSTAYNNLLVCGCTCTTDDTFVSRLKYVYRLKIKLTERRLT